MSHAQNVPRFMNIMTASLTMVSLSVYKQATSEPSEKTQKTMHGKTNERNTPA